VLEAEAFALVELTVMREGLRVGIEVVVLARMLGEGGLWVAWQEEEKLDVELAHSQLEVLSWWRVARSVGVVAVLQASSRILEETFGVGPRQLQR